MYVDWGIELGRDDAALALPWSSEDGACRYLDIRSDPSLIDQIAEANAYPELRAFLLRLNAPDSELQSAKCDAWLTQEINPEEQLFNATWKLGSYVDLLFVRCDFRDDLNRHESCARRFSSLLSRVPDCSASAEIIVRRCYYQAVLAAPAQTVRPYDLPALDHAAPCRHFPCAGKLNRHSVKHMERIAKSGQSRKGKQLHTRSPEGFKECIGLYFTVYISGFGRSACEARQHWSNGCELVKDALLQTLAAVS